MKEREEAILAALFEDPLREDPLCEGPTGRAGLTPDERSEVEELQELVLAARGLGGDTSSWSPIREGALVGRVLAKTTREDLSWRGDLALVTSFVRERLAASPVLKLVAASLLVHLAALPVLGWYVLREPRVQPTITFDVPLETAETEFLEEPEAPIETANDQAAHLTERIENARRRARYVLTHGQGPVVQPAREAPLEIRLLALRTVGEEDRWEAWLDDREGFERADRLQRALWIELLLDRNVASGKRSPLLAFGLNGLAQAERAAAFAKEDVGARPQPVTALEGLVLERARAYGLWEGADAFDPRSAPEPFGPRWWALLERALQARGLGGDPIPSAVRSHFAR